MTEKDPFINWYRQRFEKLNESPPEEVWNSISQNLSINEAWQGIDSKLNRRKRRKVLFRRSSYALALLLLLFISGNLLLNLFGKTIGEKILAYGGGDGNSIRRNTIIKSKNFKTNPKTTLALKKQGASNSPVTQSPVFAMAASSNKNNSKQESKQTEVIPPENTLAKTETIKATIFTESTAIKNQKNESALITNKNTPAKVESPTTTFSESPFATMSMLHAQLVEEMQSPSVALNPITIPDSTFATKHPDSDSKFKGYYAGAISSFNNIWLLNNETFSGLNNNSINQTNINIGNSYGISVGYGFHDKWTTELNWYMNSHQGQTYHVYEEGRYLSKNISLNYTIVNLSLRQRKTSLTRWPHLTRSQGLITGLNYGYLKNAKEVCGQKTEITKDNYRVSDFGLCFGYGYEFLAYSKILFTASLNTNIGLKNIYSGTDFIPAGFNRTHNASAGIQLGIKYLFR